MSSIITLITNIVSIIVNWFKIKSTNTLKNIQDEREILKNEIIRELNNNDADLHYIDRLYSKLRDLSKRENKL